MSAAPGDVATAFELRLRELIDGDRVTLGSVPAVVARIGSAAQQDETTAQQLADVVAADPTLAARLLRVANGALHRGRSPVSKLHLAIARLGLPLARSLVLAMALSHSVRPSHGELRGRMARQWARSIEAAAISRVLAEHYTQLDADEAFVAGLVHRIGVLPIINLADQTPAIAIRLDILDRSIGAWQARVGSWLLRNWGFAAEMAELPLKVDDLMRAHAGPVELADVVTVAIIQSTFAQGHTGPPVEFDRYPAWRKLGLDPTGLALSANVDEQIREARSLFE